MTHLPKSRSYMLIILLFFLLTLSPFVAAQTETEPLAGQPTEANPDAAPSQVVEPESGVVSLLGPTAVTGALVVNTANLSPTSAGAMDGACDLREAMQAAVDAHNSGQNAQFNECQASPGPTFITFAPNVAGQTITLAPGNDILPFVNHNMTITGPIVISGGGRPASNPPANNYDSRLFRTAGGGTLNLVNLTIKNGFTVGGGGAILGAVNSTINLVGVSMMDNTAYGDGGAINTDGALNILMSNFSNNVALGRNANDYSNNPGTGYGGAVYITGSGGLKTSLSNFSGNTASKGGGAIAVYQGTAVEISDTNFAGNIAQADNSGDTLVGGGAIYNYSGSISIIRSPFSGNVTPKGYGGAIFNNLSAPGLLINDSSFNANVSGDASTVGRGGAIYTEEDTTINRSTFNANVVLGNGLGGAIVNNRAAVLRVNNSTFLGNVIVSGIDAAGQGGAIANIDTPFPVSSDSTVELRNVTLTDNKAQSGGAIYNAELVRLWNTIITEGTIGGGGTCAGTAPQNQGNNIQHPGAACGAAINSADPKLDTPNFNGGALATLVSLMPKEGSPAIDGGNNDICNGAQVNKQDQRGSERPKDGTGNGNKVCDIGAIEAGTAAPGFGSDPVQPGPLDFGNALPGQPQTFTMQVIETGRQALTVNSGSISGPNAAAFSIVTSFPIVIPNGGDNVPLELRCEPPNTNPGLRTATLTLTTNDPDKLQVTYDLRCTVPASSTPALGTMPDVPGPIDMGATPVGVLAVRPLHLWSAGTGTLNVGTPTITGANAAEFAFGALQPGTILLGCTPTGTGLRVATFNLPSNDPNRPVASFDLLCRGTAVQPPHLATPAQSLLVGLGAGSAGPYDVVVSDDGRFLYATDYGDHMVVAYRRNELGGLELLGVYQNGFGGVSRMERPVFLTLSPDGRNLYVAASQSNAIVTFTRNPETGDLTYLSAVGEGDGYGCFPAPCSGFVSGLNGAYAVAVSPDGRYLYATGNSSSALTVLRRNTSDGSLRSFLFGANFVQSYTHSDLSGARGLTISPDGLHIYAAALTADALSVFQRNATNGQVTWRQTVRDAELVTLNPPTFVDGLDGATDVIVSEDGRHVYVTGNLDNSVALFSRNALTGNLFFIASYDADLGTANGLAGAISLILSPDGRTLYATGFFGDSVAVFARDANTGRLTQTQQATQSELDGATGIAAAPDGTAVYVTAWNSNRIINLRLSNPMPEIDSLLPASAAGGSGAFPLVIRGQNFLPTTEVRWNGSPRAVTYVSPTELRVAILGTDLSTNPAVTAAAVQVRNLTPGGGTTATIFTITQGGQPPVPSIASLAPQSLPAGASSVQMTVYGANFLPTAQVLWNGAARPTTFINSGELRFTISGAALLNPGAAAVSVVNGVSALAEGVYAPENSGGSNRASFVVAAPGQNPAPTLNSAFPNHVLARGAASRPVSILLTGQHFVEGAQAQWNGADRPTVAISSTQLRVTLTAADVAFGASGGLRVVNPGPGGGPSNTATFSVFPHALYLPMMTR